jgi:hypothetical protein
LIFCFDRTLCQNEKYFTERHPPGSNPARSLSDLGNQSENSAGRGQVLSILQGNSCSIAQKSGETWTVQTDLQQIYPKSDRLLGGTCSKIEKAGTAGMLS